jgi:hypothetical protein
MLSFIRMAAGFLRLAHVQGLGADADRSAVVRQCERGHRVKSATFCSCVSDASEALAAVVVEAKRGRVDGNDHRCLAAAVLRRLLADRLEDVVDADARALQQSERALARGARVANPTDDARRPPHDVGGQRNQPLRATEVAKLRIAELFPSPLSRVVHVSKTRELSGNSAEDPIRPQIDSIPRRHFVGPAPRTALAWA